MTDREEPRPVIDVPTIELLDGNRIPAVGFGSPDADPSVAAVAFAAAFEAGYRLVDTAQAYGNEDVVGRAVRDSGLPREQIQVATKVPGKDHGYDETLASFDVSLANLGLDYVDFYLIHWPNPAYDRYVDTWRAMIELRERGRVRSIGVCNFTGAYVDRLVRETGVAPVVNQIERHPLFPNDAQLAADRERGVVTESWSALGRGHSFIDDPVIGRVAEAHGVTPGQAVLRWHVQGDSVPISYSRRPERVRQNIDVFSFELTADEIAAISSLESGRIWHQDPTESNYL